MTTVPTPLPRPDPLVDEVRAIRREISDRFQNDVRKLADYLREIEGAMQQRPAASHEAKGVRPS